MGLGGSSSAAVVATMGWPDNVCEEWYFLLLVVGGGGGRMITRIAVLDTSCSTNKSCSEFNFTF